VQIAVADHKYGTSENYVACQQRAITTHMGDASQGQNNHHCRGIFADSEFVYDAASDTFRCPAGQLLRPRGSTQSAAPSNTSRPVKSAPSVRYAASARVRETDARSNGTSISPCWIAHVLRPEVQQLEAIKTPAAFD